VSSVNFVGRSAGDDVVRLVPIGAGDHAVRDALAAQQLSPEQRRFVIPAAESLTLGDADPDRHSVAILAGAQPVGMFALDRGGYFREFDDDPRAVLLRAFYLAAEYQGRGYARSAIAALAEFVRDELPDVRRVILTVNHENPAAVRAYLAGGFHDTGRDYLGGDAGPQHVLELTL
jgi:GNAT superfamily N-acetyltransferase